MAFHPDASPVEVDVFLAGHDGPGWEVAPFRHRSGWLMIAEASLTNPFGRVSATLVAAISDQGEVFSPEVAARLLGMPTGLPRDAEVGPPAALAMAMDALYWDFLGTTDLDSLRRLEEAEMANDARIAAFEAECAAFESKLWTAMRQLRVERRRHDMTSEQRAAIEARLARLLIMTDELAADLRERLREMRTVNDELEAAVMESLTDHGELETLTALRWRARHDQPRHADHRLPVRREPGLTRHAWDDDGLAGCALERLTLMRPFRHERDEA